MRVLLGRFELKRTCKGCGKGVRGERQPLEIASNGSPASQTLIVLSSDPDTIFVPSGEKATELMSRLWALAFSVMRFREPAREARRRQFWQKKGDSKPKTHPNPRL